jgi:hypothetical protein
MVQKPEGFSKIPPQRGEPPAKNKRDKKTPVEDPANSGNLESSGFCNIGDNFTPWVS